MGEQDKPDNLQEKIYDKYTGTSVEVKDIILTKMLQKILKNENRRLKILDVGCGDGHLYKQMIKQIEIHGLDVSKEMLKTAANIGINAQRIDLEMGVFPFSSDHFDAIVCSEVIEHLIMPDHMLAEINRVLKAKGYFLLTLPNINQPLSLMIQTLLDLPPVYSAHYKSPHYRDYTLRIAKWLVRSYGFEIISIKGTNIYPVKSFLSRKIAEIFPRFGEKLVIMAQKTKEPNKKLRKLDVIWNQREFLHNVQITG